MLLRCCSLLVVLLTNQVLRVRGRRSARNNIVEFKFVTKFDVVSLLEHHKHDYAELLSLMSLQIALSWLRGIILAVAIVSTTYLYLYPYHLGCAFPSTTGSVRDGFTHTRNTHLNRARDDSGLAPFRLLVLADPQLEGDSSLPDPEDALLARLRAHGTHIFQSLWTNITVSNAEDDGTAVERLVGSTTAEKETNETVLNQVLNATDSNRTSTKPMDADSTSQTLSDVLSVIESSSVVSDGSSASGIIFSSTGSEKETQTDSVHPPVPTTIDTQESSSSNHIQTDETLEESGEILLSDAVQDSLSTTTRFTPLAPFSTLLTCLREVLLEDIPKSLWAVRKTIDLFGNDYYLAHIYRTLNWWSNPTHVTVLGDLIGSQWVSDDEFEWRSWRFWNRVFAGSRQVKQEAMNMHLRFKEDQQDFEIDDTWRNQIINIAGNHDIGYAGDISRARLERFEREFGKVNWDVKFVLPQDQLTTAWKDSGREAPKIQLIVLNSMLLDTPALDGGLQSATYEYINGLISDRIEPLEARNTTFTLLLTHVPLHKPEGVCVDAPMFEFWDFEDGGGAFKDGGLREQNHLSDHTSHQGVLQTIFGMNGDVGIPLDGQGRNGLILNGHDHEGCDSVHYIERTFKPLTFDGGLDQDNTSTGSSIAWNWKSVKTGEYPEIELSKEDGRLEIVASLREITMRSMMGEFSGNAGLMSAWFDFEQELWKYEIMMCPVGVQHIWWATHIIDIVAVVVLITMPWLNFSTKHQITPKNETRLTRKESITRAVVNGRPRNSLHVPRPTVARSPSQGRRKG